MDFSKVDPSEVKVISRAPDQEAAPDSAPATVDFSKVDPSQVKVIQSAAPTPQAAPAEPSYADDLKTVGSWADDKAKAVGSSLLDGGKAVLGSVADFGHTLARANKAAGQAIMSPVSKVVNKVAGSDVIAPTESQLYTAAGARQAMRGVNNTVLPYFGNKLVEKIGGPTSESPEDAKAAPGLEDLGGAAALALPSPVDYAIGLMGKLAKPLATPIARAYDRAKDTLLDHLANKAAQEETGVPNLFNSGVAKETAAMAKEKATAVHAAEDKVVTQGIEDLVGAKDPLIGEAAATDRKKLLQSIKLDRDKVGGLYVDNPKAPPPKDIEPTFSEGVPTSDADFATELAAQRRGRGPAEPKEQDFGMGSKAHGALGKELLTPEGQAITDAARKDPEKALEQINDVVSKIHDSNAPHYDVLNGVTMGGKGFSVEALQKDIQRAISGELRPGNTTAANAYKKLSDEIELLWQRPHLESMEAQKAALEAGFTPEELVAFNKVKSADDYRALDPEGETGLRSRFAKFRHENMKYSRPQQLPFEEFRQLVTDAQQAADHTLGGLSETERYDMRQKLYKSLLGSMNSQMDKAVREAGMKGLDGMMGTPIAAKLAEIPRPSRTSGMSREEWEKADFAYKHDKMNIARDEARKAVEGIRDNNKRMFALLSTQDALKTRMRKVETAALTKTAPKTAAGKIGAGIGGTVGGVLGALVDGSAGAAPGAVMGGFAGDAVGEHYGPKVLDYLATRERKQARKALEALKNGGPSNLRKQLADILSTEKTALGYQQVNDGDDDK